MYRVSCILYSIATTRRKEATLSVSSTVWILLSTIATIILRILDVIRGLPWIFNVLHIVKGSISMRWIMSRIRKSLYGLDILSREVYILHTYCSLNSRLHSVIGFSIGVHPTTRLGRAPLTDTHVRAKAKWAFHHFDVFTTHHAIEVNWFQHLVSFFICNGLLYTKALFQRIFPLRLCFCQNPLRSNKAPISRLWTRIFRTGECSFIWTSFNWRRRKRISEYLWRWYVNRYRCDALWNLDGTWRETEKGKVWHS